MAMLYDELDSWLADITRAYDSGDRICKWNRIHPFWDEFIVSRSSIPENAKIGLQLVGFYYKLDGLRYKVEINIELYTETIERVKDDYYSLDRFFSGITDKMKSDNDGACVTSVEPKSVKPQEPIPDTYGEW